MMLHLMVGCFIFAFPVSDGACTFPTAFQNSVWLDNTKGTLTFTDTTMSGWAFMAFTSAILSQWECYDTSLEDTLILKTVQTISFSSLTLKGYLCMRLFKITDYSYYYYQLYESQGNAGNERIYVASSTAAVSASDACDSAIVVPESEYHVIVKNGFAAQAIQPCPTPLLARYDYTYMAADGATACGDSEDMWDICTNTSVMTFDYSTCSQTMLYSASGVLFCLVAIESGGAFYTSVYNNDTAVSGPATYRFSCVVIDADGTTASVTFNNCTSSQTPSSFPIDGNGDEYGAVLTLSAYERCTGGGAGEEAGSSTGGVVGAAVGGLFGIVAVVVIVIVIVIVFRKRKKSPSKESLVEDGAVATVDQPVSSKSPRKKKSTPSEKEKTQKGKTKKDKVKQDKEETTAAPKVSEPKPEVVVQKPSKRVRKANTSPESKRRKEESKNKQGKSSPERERKSRAMSKSKGGKRRKSSASSEDRKGQGKSRSRSTTPESSPEPSSKQQTSKQGLTASPDRKRKRKPRSTTPSPSSSPELDRIFNKNKETELDEDSNSTLSPSPKSSPEFIRKSTTEKRQKKGASASPSGSPKSRRQSQSPKGKPKKKGTLQPLKDYLDEVGGREDDLKTTASFYSMNVPPMTPVEINEMAKLEDMPLLASSKNAPKTKSSPKSPRQKKYKAKEDSDTPNTFGRRLPISTPPLGRKSPKTARKQSITENKDSPMAQRKQRRRNLKKTRSQTIKLSESGEELNAFDDESEDPICILLDTSDDEIAELTNANLLSPVSEIDPKEERLHEELSVSPSLGSVAPRAESFAHKAFSSRGYHSDTDVSPIEVKRTSSIRKLKRRNKRWKSDTRLERDFSRKSRRSQLSARSLTSGQISILTIYDQRRMKWNNLDYDREEELKRIYLQDLLKGLNKQSKGSKLNINVPWNNSVLLEDRGLYSFS